ncbi:MAG: hypothetical protein ACOX0U_10660 [Oscillospiraceae bacterium]
METPEKLPCDRHISSQKAPSFILLTAHSGQYKIPSNVLAFAEKDGGKKLFDMVIV